VLFAGASWAWAMEAWNVTKEATAKAKMVMRIA
jgi:hypothetical protein